MFSFQEYLIGWLVYVAATLGVLLAFWRLTRHLPWFYAKQCLRLAVAAILLVPMTISSDSFYWAPAWIQGILLLIFEGMEGFWPVARILLLAMLLALLVYLLLELAILAYKRRKQADT